MTNEEQQELERFPAILRQLIEDELAAGNELIEIGHSFPAPPVGAYFKLLRKVTTRPTSLQNRSWILESAAQLVKLSRGKSKWL